MEAQKQPISSDAQIEEIRGRIRAKSARASMQDADLEAYLSAEERAQRIEADLKDLASPLAELTPHLYKMDRPRFDAVDREVQAGLTRVETMAIGLRMAADSEYAPEPWHVRMILWIFSFIGPVHDIRRPMIKARHRYEARIRAVERYEELAENTREEIRSIRYAKVDLRAKEILLAHKDYQKTLGQYVQMAAVHRGHGSFASPGCYCNRSKHRNWSAWLELTEKTAHETALQEFSGDDL